MPLIIVAFKEDQQRLKKHLMKPNTIHCKHLEARNGEEPWASQARARAGEAEMLPQPAPEPWHSQPEQGRQDRRRPLQRGDGTGCLQSELPGGTNPPGHSVALLLVALIRTEDGVWSHQVGRLMAPWGCCPEPPGMCGCEE